MGKKRRLLGLVAGLGILGLIALVAAENGERTPKGENSTIVGQVIDIADYAMFGRYGEGHMDSGAYRAEHGFPIGVLAEDGQVWIAVYRLPVPAAGLQTANETLGPLMGKQVVVQGLLFRAPGINVIRVSLAREM